MGRTTETLQEQQGKQEMTIALPPTTPVTPEEMRAELAKLQDTARLNSRATFRGDILKFVKGEWGLGFGESRRWVPDGSQAVCVLSELGHGWRKFETMLDEDGHEVTRPRYVVGRIAEFVPPARHELGDTDRSQWKISMLTKQLEDPWVQIVTMLLVARDGESAMTFIADSPTGVERTWAFIEDAARAGKHHLGQDPVIELKAGGFTSRRTKFWVDTPGFRIVGWIGRRDPELLPQGGGSDSKGGAEQEPPEHEQVPLDAYDDR